MKHPITILLLIFTIAALAGIAYNKGARDATQKTSDDLMLACDAAIENTKKNERKIARWFEYGCDTDSDCEEWERAQAADFEYRASSGDWR